MVVTKQFSELKETVHKGPYGPSLQDNREFKYPVHLSFYAYFCFGKCPPPFLPSDGGQRLSTDPATSLKELTVQWKVGQGQRVRVPGVAGDGDLLRQAGQSEEHVVSKKPRDRCEDQTARIYQEEPDSPAGPPPPTMPLRLSLLVTKVG